jgi:lipid II:glycine glycyltransferase (peptidoglycan interpeptide bridge formation enzyme)
MEIKYFKEEEKEIWNDFISNTVYGDILHYWQWGETKRVEGWIPERIAVLEDGEIILSAQMLMKKASFLGNYLYIAHGPVFKNKDSLKQALVVLKKELIIYAKKHNCFVIEIEPKVCFIPEEDLTTPIISKNLQAFIDPAIIKIFENNGFRRTNRNTQPKFKLFYDLENSEEELLLQMKKNTRYNVRLAARKGVEIAEYKLTDPKINEIITQFYLILMETQKRAQGYPIRPLIFFKEITKQFKDTDCISIFEARYQNQIIAMNITQKTKSWASSFYAASNRLFTEVKAPYLLRWKAVQAAKQFGSKVYDFWGIIPNSSQHLGYSENKLSFGGARINTYGLLALPLNNLKFIIWDKAIKYRANLSSLLKK